MPRGFCFDCRDILWFLSVKNAKGAEDEVAAFCHWLLVPLRCRETVNSLIC